MSSYLGALLNTYKHMENMLEGGLCKHHDSSPCVFLKRPLVETAKIDSKSPVIRTSFRSFFREMDVTED